MPVEINNCAFDMFSMDAHLTWYLNYDRDNYYRERQFFDDGERSILEKLSK